MGRRVFSREFKVEAVWLVVERGVAVAQAAKDLGLHENVLYVVNKNETEWLGVVGRGQIVEGVEKSWFVQGVGIGFDGVRAR